MSRRIRLVVCTSSGDILGSLPEYSVEEPWWSEVAPVVDGARGIFGIDVTVLRLLSADSPTPMAGGTVTYLVELDAETLARLSFAPVNAGIDGGEQPLRAAWARPGGVGETVAWADATLAAAGRPRTGRVAQVKSWNLSSALRLPTETGDVWCKSVPPFMVDEGSIIALIAADDPTLVPEVLASDAQSRTVLLAHVPGEDQYDATEDRLIEMVRRLVALQTRWVDRIDELLEAGLWDARAISLPARFRALLARPDVRACLDETELASLDVLLEELPARLEAVAACGLPETLVHGDFHPGNWRFGSDGLVLLDWGDARVGHPLFDFAGTFLSRVPEPSRSRVRTAWLEAWRAEYTAADPERAAELLAPIAPVLGALVYQGFLDGIEPTERPYHEADVPACLRWAVAELQR